MVLIKIWIPSFLYHWNYVKWAKIGIALLVVGLSGLFLPGMFENFLRKVSLTKKNVLNKCRFFPLMLSKCMFAYRKWTYHLNLIFVQCTWRYHSTLILKSIYLIYWIRMDLLEVLSDEMNSKLANIQSIF